MERALGIGGYFLRATDPEALGAWYRDALGIEMSEYGEWHPEAGPTVIAFSSAEDAPFDASRQHSMLNLRVRDVDAMLAQLREHGATVSPEVDEMQGVGRFGWVLDPEGNRIELWEPEG